MPWWGTGLISLGAALLALEVSGLSKFLSRKILARAVAALPERRRKTRDREWQALFDDWDRASVLRLAWTLSLLIGARRTARVDRESVTSWASLNLFGRTASRTALRLTQPAAPLHIKSFVDRSVDVDAWEGDHHHLYMNGYDSIAVFVGRPCDMALMKLSALHQSRRVDHFIFGTIRWFQSLVLRRAHVLDERILCSLHVRLDTVGKVWVGRWWGRRVVFVELRREPRTAAELAWVRRKVARCLDASAYSGTVHDDYDARRARASYERNAQRFLLLGVAAMWVWMGTGHNFLLGGLALLPGLIASYVANLPDLAKRTHLLTLTQQAEGTTTSTTTVAQR